MDYIPLFLNIEKWWQAVSHGEKWPSQSFRFSARPRSDETFRIVGDRFRDLSAHLSIVRSEPSQNKPERGIGILAYHPEREAQYDAPGSEAFIGGWFWMPTQAYDEIWDQVRESSYLGCSLEIDVAPVDFDAM